MIKTGYCAGAVRFTCTVSVRIAEANQDCRYLSTGRQVKSPSLPLSQHVTHTPDNTGRHHHLLPGDRVHLGSQARVCVNRKQEEPSKYLINEQYTSTNRLTTKINLCALIQIIHR